MHNQAEPPPAPLPFHDLLDAHTLGLPICGDESDPVIVGDKALVAGDIGKAVECYQSVHDMSDDTSCKLGFALMLLDQIPAAKQHLSKNYCRATSNGTAALAFLESTRQQHETLKRAVSMEPSGAYARIVYLRSRAIWEDREFAIQLAESAIAEFQRHDLLAIRDRLLHSLDRTPEVHIEQLLAHGVRYPDCAAAVLEISLSTGNVRAGLHAVDLLLGHNEGRSNADLEAEILRTQLYLVDAGKTFKPDSIKAARDHLNAALALGFGPQTHHNLATVFDLQLRLYERDEAGAQELAEKLGALLLLDENSTGMDDDMSPVRLSPYWEMVISSSILDVEHVSSIAADNGAWEQSIAVGRLLKSEADPDPEDQDALVDAVLARPVATWMYGPAVKAMIGRERVVIPTLARWLVLDSKAYGEFAAFPDEVQSIPTSDLVELAAHLLSESAAASNDGGRIGDISPHWLIKSLVDMGRPDLAVAITEVSHEGLKSNASAFSLAYALHLGNRLVDAAAIYRNGLVDDDFWGHTACRNLAICYQGLKAMPELTKLAERVKEKTGAPDAGDEWKNLHREIAGWLAQLTTPPTTTTTARDDAVQALFREYSSIKANTQPDVHQLTLGQAVALMALLRAGEIDHATWKIGPIKGGEVSFDPTGRFLPLLGSLVEGGLLGVGSVRTDGIHFDGQKAAFDWDAVTFKLPPSTMDLHRSIRDLSQQEWPIHWRQELETLATSLATEECMAYMEHLADERNLDLPADADLRATFVSQLQFAPVSQCWYFAFLAARATNDYRTKYRAGQKQIASYMLKRLRTTGESAQAGNWENRNFGRIKALPRTLFAGALHDVFTGWGESAFDQEIRALIA